MVGLSKSAIPGLGILFVPLFAQVLPARASTGALLPLLILGDVFAVILYRRHAVWGHLVRLLPWTAAGIVLGFLLMGKLDDAVFKPVLGALVIVMLAVNLGRDLRARGPKTDREPSLRGWPAVVFSAVMGLLAGATTMVANAAGPVMMVYLLSMRLPKDEFLGTSAWFFLIVNCVKVPFSAGLGLITPPSLLLDAALSAAVVAGALAGAVAAKRMPQKVFGIAVQALSLGAAVLMFF